MGKQKHDVGRKKRTNLLGKPVPSNRSAKAAWRELSPKLGYGNFHTGAAAK